jgi:hypothetical protein
LCNAASVFGAVQADISLIAHNSGVSGSTSMLNDLPDREVCHRGSPFYCFIPSSEPCRDVGPELEQTKSRLCARETE